jgi:hypothetical protein
VPIEGTAPGTYNQVFVADLLTQRIEYSLIHQELVRRRAQPDQAALTQARQEVTQRLTVAPSQGLAPVNLLQSFPTSYQDTLVQRQAEVDALRGSLAKVDVSDQAVRQYYDTHQDQFVTEICVRHILLIVKDAAGNVDAAASKARAAQVKALLDQGTDFATLAKTYSLDTGSAANGGKLTGTAPDGCLNSTDVGQLVPAFAQAMIALPVNKISDPVASQFGSHVIQVTARTVEPFDAKVVASARQSLSQPSQQAFADLLNSLIQHASVKVDPQFGHFDAKGNPAAGQAPGIVPPKGPQIQSGGGPLSPTPSTTTPPGG